MISSGPVSATSLTVGTLRQTSTNVSADGAFVVQLQIKPTVDQSTITENSISATVYMAEASTDSYEIAAASITPEARRMRKTSGMAE